MCAVISEIQDAQEAPTASGRPRHCRNQNTLNRYRRDANGLAAVAEHIMLNVILQDARLDATPSCGRALQYTIGSADD